MKNMTDKEKTEAVLRCESFKELSDVVILVGTISGSRGMRYDVSYTLDRIKEIASAKVDHNCYVTSDNRYTNGYQIFNSLPRAYGIRQQAIYIKMYGAG